MATELFDAIGAEGFTSQQDVEDKTAWTNTSSLAVVNQNILGLAGETWFQANLGNNELLRDMSGIQIVNARREIEVSVAYYINSTSSPGNTNQDLINIYPATNPAFGIFLDTVADATFADNRGIRLNINLGGYNGESTTYPTQFRNDAGTLLYVTMRLRAQSAAGAADGALQVYINGEEIVNRTDVNLSSTTAGVWEASDWTFLVTGTTGTQVRYRSLCIQAGWTAASGQVFNHVADLLPDVVTTADFTNEGGAANEVAAVTDGSDTTYLEGLAAADTVVFDLPDTDPLLSAKEVTGIYTRWRAARATAGANTATFRARTDATGGVAIFDTETAPIAALAPTFGAVEVSLNITAPATLADLGVDFTNG